MTALLLCNTLEEIRGCKKKIGTIDVVYIATKSWELYCSLKRRGMYIPIFVEYDMRIDNHEVWAALDMIFLRFKTIMPEAEFAVLTPDYHIEGGGIQQNIADVFLAIKFFGNLLDDKSIDKIVVTGNLQLALEREVLKLLSSFYKIDFRVVNGYYSLRKVRRYEWLLWRAPKAILYTIYRIKAFMRIVKVIKIKVNADKISGNMDVGILVRSESIRFIDWREKAADRLTGGFTVMMICVDSPKAADKLKQDGYPAECAESYVSIILLAKRVWKYLRECLIYKKLGKSINYSYNNLDISILLRRFFLIHIYSDVFTASIDKIILEEYYRKKEFKIIRAWGSEDFAITRASYYCTLNSRPLYYLDYDYPFAPVELYSAWSKIMDVRFLATQYDKYTFVQDQGFKGRNYVIPAIEYTAEFADGYKDNNFIYNNNLTILWAPGALIKGFTTISSLRQCLNGLCEYICNTEYNLMIKFHPKQDLKVYKDIISKYEPYPNIQFVEKETRIKDVLEKADIVISSFSTVLNDGVIMGKPVICVAIDDLTLYMLKNLRRGLYLCNRLGQLVFLLNKWRYKPDVFERWRSLVLERQYDYFQRVYGDNHHSPGDIMVNILRCEMKQRECVMCGGENIE